MGRGNDYIMKKIVSMFSILLISIFSFGLAGCSTNEEPSKVLNDYYDSIKKGDAESAYNDLASANKKNFEKDDFIKWYNNLSEFQTLKSVNVKKSNEYKNGKLDGIDYKNIIEFDITETDHSNYDDKDSSVKYKRYVVNDNGEWKVYRAKEDGKAKIAYSMNDLAWMYIEGKGKNKDLNRGAAILNEAIKINPENNDSYYALSYTYCLLGKYDESITAVNKYINMASDEKDKSRGYNILGLGYESKKDYTNAKKYYTQAVQLNSNNQYANSNLLRVNKIMQSN